MHVRSKTLLVRNAPQQHRELGIAALAAGRGPRTASNDLYHRTMLVLIGTSLLILVFGRSALLRSRNRAGKPGVRTAPQQDRELVPARRH
jgi:hypothetical protein